MTILITGGSGSLGRSVVRAALDAGLRVRVGSRRPRPAQVSPLLEWAPMDLATGDGFAAALAGADAVIHAASDPQRSIAVDVNGTRLLLAAAQAAGTPHFVFVSIVGIDRIPLGYYGSKLAAEQIVAAGAVPWSILRATQFHSFVDTLLAATLRFPLVMPIPAGLYVQSVATEDVAHRLLRCLTDGPRQRLPDLGGPDVLTLADAAHQWKAARAVRKPMVQVPVPGKVARAFRAGENIARDGERGAISWPVWLRRAANRMGT